MVAGIKTTFLTVCLRGMSITLLRMARQRVSALHKMASVAYVMRYEEKGLQHAPDPCRPRIPSLQISPAALLRRAGY